MSENFDLADAILEFGGGTAAVWATFDKPIPNNVVIFTTDTMRFKKGDGSSLYSALPDGPSFSEVMDGSQELLDSLVSFDNTHDDQVIYINNDRYDTSTTTLTSILDRIAAINTEDNAQDANLDTVDNQNNLLDLTVNAGDDDKLTVISSGKITPGSTVAEMGGIIVPADKIHIQGVNIYTDDGLVNQVDALRSNNTHFVEVDGFHDEHKNSEVTFALTEDSSLTTIEKIANNIFKIVVSATNTNETVSLAATATYNTDTANKTYVTDIVPFKPLVGIYGSTGDDRFQAVTVDSNDNIICAGFTASEGQGGNDTLVVKFDSSLNILARKVYGGSGDDYWHSIITDSNDNIICVGNTTSEGQGNQDVLVVKFDNSLNILVRKIYGGSDNDYLHGVAVDSSDNIICAGFTASEGQGSYNTLVVKFDSSLNILARKVYSGSGSDAFRDTAVDSNDNIICAGYTSSEGQGSYDALVVKFDSSLSILARKVYGGSGDDRFYDLAIDSNDNIICAGYTSSEGQGSYDALAVKFDSSLSILARKVYGGSADDRFYGVTIDSNDDIICTSFTASEGQGGNDALTIKFDSSLNILARKIYGGSGSSDFFLRVAVDSSDNIICVGYTESEGQGNFDGLVVKFPADLPSGSFTGNNIGLILADSDLTLADSALTLANSALTLADSTLTLANSALTLANSNLAYNTDVIG